MYKIYADDICIYNDQYQAGDGKIINPKLTLGDNSAGSLSITVPPTNAGYGKIKHMTTIFTVYKSRSLSIESLQDSDGGGMTDSGNNAITTKYAMRDREVWSGRVLSEEQDFWNNRVLYIEGELAYLNDSTQPPAEYHDITVRGFLETLLNIHNAKVSSDKQFKVGAVTVTDNNDSLYRYTNYEKTIECINDKLINRLGGHLRIRKADGVRYLDYLADYPSTNSQVIEFGKNILDFTKSWDLSEFATVIVPRGAQLDESPIDALTAYLTVESVNDGSIYVMSPDAIAEYGWIEKVVDWEDVTTADILLNKAKTYLSEIQFDNMQLELSAVDLHYLDVNVEDIHIQDEIRVISKPHGMDRYFPVTEMEIPLDSPEDTTFTLGDAVSGSLTNVNNKTNSEILKKIENLPSKSSVLQEAQDNAAQLLNSATSGYVTISRNDDGAEALYVSNNPDISKATKIWRWNINGLGYSNDGGKSYNVAMTMDGSIVADCITSGKMRADMIEGGTLTLGGKGNTYGSLIVKDANGKQIGKWDKDGITLPSNATIAWSNVSGKPGNLATTDDVPTSDQITVIANNAITTAKINATQITAGTLNGITFYSKNSSGTYIQISNGIIRGGRNSNDEAGYLDFGNTFNSNKALHIRAENLVLCATNFAVGQSKDATSVSKGLQDYDCRYVVSMSVNGSNISWTSSVLVIRNGLIVGRRAP